MSDPINILVIDDHPLLREGVCSTLSAAADFNVVGEGASYSDAIEKAHELIPDTILLDISMPGGARHHRTFVRAVSVVPRQTCNGC